MKQILHIFLYLNIYTAFYYIADAQELTLILTAEISISDSLSNSLNKRTKHKNYKSIQEETQDIAFRLERLGYLESRLKMVTKKNDSVFEANYFFGKKTPLITIYYKPQFLKAEDLKIIAELNDDDSFTIPISEVEKKLALLNKNIAKDGNAFARLNLSTFKIVDGKFTAILESENGQRRTIDSIAIKGYDKFPKSFIKYFAGVKNGIPFDQKKLIKQNKTLNSLGFINTLKAPEALFRKDSTVVYFYVEKRNFNNFDGILGFSTNEETNTIAFNGYLNLELNNNLNFGEQFLLNYKADGNDQRNFRIKTILPYIAKTPIGISMELKLFRRDSTFSNTGQTVNINYQLNPKTTIGLGYAGKTSSSLLEQNSLDITDYSSRYISTSMDYNNIQNSILFPKKTTISTKVAFGNRDRNNKKERQTIIENNISHIIRLNDKNSVYLRNSTSFLISPDYLTNELFRFGGIQSIRGFTENSIDASLYSVLNTEYRYLLNQTSFIHSIIDIGYFENKILAQKEKLYSFGFGLGIITKAGILNLNIANGNIDSQDFKFSNTKIHISLTSRF